MLYRYRAPLICCLVFVAAMAIDAREWNYKGRTIQGEIDNVQGDVVYIRRDRGGVAIVRTYELSREDREYIRQWQRRGSNQNDPTPSDRPTTGRNRDGNNRQPTGASPWAGVGGTESPGEQPPQAAPPAPTPESNSGNLNDIRLGPQAPGSPSTSDPAKAFKVAGFTVAMLAFIASFFVVGVVIGGVFLYLASRICQAKVTLGRCMLTVFAAWLLNVGVRYAINMATDVVFLQAAGSTLIGIFIMWGMVTWLLDVSPGKGCLICIVHLLLGLMLLALLLAVVFLIAIATGVTMSQFSNGLPFG